jgi:hypothetical protein
MFTLELLFEKETVHVKHYTMPEETQASGRAA